MLNLRGISMKHLVKIKSITKITPDVLQITTNRPAGISFTPGQATEISINKSGWLREKRPFTFTSLPDNDFLQFIIKTYPAHREVTNELLSLKRNDELVVHDVFGTISYQGEGVFIAGGAGVTPFISIFRYLQSKGQVGANKLIFANKTKADIILEQEFKKLLVTKFINILSDEKVAGYAHGYITEDFLKAHIPNLKVKFYLCGPPPMMDSLEEQLAHLKVPAKSIVKEAF